MLCVLGRLRIRRGGPQVGLRAHLSRRLYCPLATTSRYLSSLQEDTATGRAGSNDVIEFKVKNVRLSIANW
jgi:hypothetical protein